MARQTYATVDEYIESFSGHTKDRLVELRKLIASVLPSAEQRIAYAIPVFWEGSYIVYFAGYDNHVSIYPVHLSGLEHELRPYLSGKSTARFSNDKPLPIDLIQKLVRALYSESQKRRRSV